MSLPCVMLVTLQELPSAGHPHRALRLFLSKPIPYQDPLHTLPLLTSSPPRLIMPPYSRFSADLLPTTCPRMLDPYCVPQSPPPCQQAVGLLQSAQPGVLTVPLLAYPHRLTRWHCCTLSAAPWRPPCNCLGGMDESIPGEDPVPSSPTPAFLRATFFFLPRLYPY